MQKQFDLLYINGEWRKGNSEDTFDNTNPYTGETLLTIQGANEEDLDEAYQAAARAQKEWAEQPPQVKRELIEKAIQIIEQEKELFIEWLIKEAGSTYRKAVGEITTAVNFMKEAASYPNRMKGEVFLSHVPGKVNKVYQEPLGVVGVISPWNFPLHLTMRSVAAALATGNGVVIKPSKDTTVTAGSLVAAVFEEAGAPKGLINLVSGKSSEIGDSFVKHPIPRMISFTGSTEVGKHIASLAAGELKSTALELGGNNVLIVMEDANIDAAVESAVYGKFYHQGQVCIALNRILVQSSVAEEFTSKFVEKVKDLRYGDPEDKNTQVGPIINEQQVDSIKEQLQRAIDAGANVLTGGNFQGNVLEPTVVNQVDNQSPLAAEEIFGPIAPIITFEIEDEAVEMANEHPFGLSGAVHSTVGHGELIAKRIETGMIHVNDQSINDEPQAPFGGVKQSGLGRFNGKWALEEFTETKWIGVQNERTDYDSFLK